MASDALPIDTLRNLPSPRLHPVDDKNLADRVADQLRETIQSGGYAPGERLVERRRGEEDAVRLCSLGAALVEQGVRQRRG